MGSSFPLKFKLNELIDEKNNPHYDLVLQRLKLVHDDGNWPEQSPEYEGFIQVICRDLDDQIPKAVDYVKKIGLTELYYEIPLPNDTVLNALNMARRKLNKERFIKHADPILGMFLTGSSE
jgi:hypothetical protein